MRRPWPTVVPPRPWTRFNRGGYLREDTMVMRGHYTIHGPSKPQLYALHLAQSNAEAGP